MMLNEIRIQLILFNYSISDGTEMISPQIDFLWIVRRQIKI